MSALGQSLQNGGAGVPVIIHDNIIPACQKYSDSDYIDLRHFVKLLLADAGITDPQVINAATEVDDILAPGPDNYVIYNQHKGSGVANSYGASVYYAKTYYDSAYSLLDFALDSLWDEFLIYYQQYY